MSSTSRYAASTVIAACVFWVVNHFHLLQQVTCSDCFFHYGVPFPFLNEGGFVGGGGIIWSGALGDAIVIVAAGVILGWIWSRASRGTSS